MVKFRPYYWASCLVYLKVKLEKVKPPSSSEPVFQEIKSPVEPGPNIILQGQS